MRGEGEGGGEGEGEGEAPPSPRVPGARAVAHAMLALRVHMRRGAHLAPRLCCATQAWEESDPRYIANSDEVKLRSFTTKVHRVDACVSYAPACRPFPPLHPPPTPPPPSPPPHRARPPEPPVPPSLPSCAAPTVPQLQGRRVKMLRASRVAPIIVAPLQHRCAPTTLDAAPCVPSDQCACAQRGIFHWDGCRIFIPWMLQRPLVSPFGLRQRCRVAGRRSSGSRCGQPQPPRP